MVTEYTGKRQHPPAPRKRWPLAALTLTLAILLVALTLAVYLCERRVPAPPQTVTLTVERTVVVTQPAPTPRTVVVYEPTYVPVDVTREVPVTVVVDRWVTPTPPLAGRG